MNKTIGAFACLALLVIVTGCTPETETIKIGWIGPLTGDAASLGVPNLEGVKLALADIEARTGTRIELIVEDDHLEYTRSRDAFIKLADVDGVSAILMASYGGVLAAGPLADAKELPMISSIDTSDELGRVGDYTFGIGIYDEGIGYRLAEHVFTTKGLGTAAVLHNKDDPVIELFASAFRDRFETLGGEVTSLPYRGNEADFRSHILKAKDTEALVVIGYDEGGLAFRRAKELGVDVPFFGIDTVTSAGHIESAGTAMEGLDFTFWADDSPAVDALTRRFVTTFGKEPENILFTAVGYDAMSALAYTMEDGTTGPGIRDRLATLEGFQGVTGDITMSPDGMVRTVKESIFRFSDGNFALIQR